MQSLWVERTTLTLVQSLPGISRWFEVDKRELVSVTSSDKIIMKTQLQHTVISCRVHCYTLFFNRLQFRALPTDSYVLIQVNKNLGHEFGAIGHISFPPLDWMSRTLKINCLALITKMSILLELSFVLFFFFLYIHLNLLHSHTVFHTNPHKSFPSWIFSVRSLRSGRILNTVLSSICKM